MSTAFVDKLTALVEEHLKNEQFGVEDLANHVGLSRSQLYRRLHAATGKSVNQFIREIRLIRAHELLQQGELTSAEVAYEVGFSSPTYFTTAFKKHYGITPGEMLRNPGTAPSATMQEQSNFPRRNRWLIAVTIALALVASVMFSTRGGWDQSSRSPVIAVLPFKIIGDDPQGVFFSEGFHDILLTELSAVQNLRVKSRTSVERYRDHAPDHGELTTSLRLTHYLEGSVQKEGLLIRLNVQLIDAANEDHLWAHTYDFQYGDLWQIQSNISDRLAEVLDLEISTSSDRTRWVAPTTNAEAWDHFLQGKYYWRSFQTNAQAESLARVVQHMKSATRFDPDFAHAYAYLALAYVQDPTFFGKDILVSIQPDSAKALCDLAIQLDPSLATSYFVRGLLQARTDTAAAYLDFEQAIKLEPRNPQTLWQMANFEYEFRQDASQSLVLAFRALRHEAEAALRADIINFLGLNYWSIGDLQKAIYYTEKAVVYEPEDTRLHRRLAGFYMMAGRYDEARASIEQLLTISGNRLGHFMLGRYFLHQERHAEAVSHFQQHFADGRIHQIEDYAYALLQSGREEEAQAIFEQVWRRPRTAGDPYLKAKLFCVGEEFDSALYYIDDVIQGPEIWPIHLILDMDPFMAAIREDPRFAALVIDAKAKLTPLQREIAALEEEGQIPSSLEELELFWRENYL